MKISEESLLFDLKMILVNKGLEEYKNQSLSKAGFREKYYNLNPDLPSKTFPLVSSAMRSNSYSSDEPNVKYGSTAAA